MIPSLLMTQEIGDAVRAATAGHTNTIDPVLIELGEYAGQWVVPAAVRDDVRIAAGARALLPQGAPIDLDYSTLWPEV